MRLFTGLEIPVRPREELERLIGRFRPVAPTLRWSVAENLHITTKFIGDWPEERLPELTAALANVPRPGPIEVRLSGLGWFPNPHQPRIFWVSVKAATPLAGLAHATEVELAVAFGITAEARVYTPHLSIARIGPSAATPVLELSMLRREVASLESTEFGEFEAREFHLYRSEPQPGGGSRYHKLESFPLRVEGDR